MLTVPWRLLLRIALAWARLGRRTEMRRLILAAVAVLAVCVPPQAHMLANMLLTGAGTGGGGGGGGSIALTGTPFSATNGAGGASVSPSGNIGSGHLAVIIARWCDDASCIGNALTTASVTAAPAGNTCTSVVHQQNPASVQIFQCPNTTAATGGTFTVTVDASVDYLDVCVAEFTNVALASPAEAGAVNSGTGFTGTATTGSTSASGDLIIGATYPTGVTGASETQVCGTSPSITYQIAGAAGTYTNTWFLSSSNPWFAAITGFKHQ